MSEQQETKTTGHSYDGIEEYDNPTPAWMTWVFLATFIFGIFYMFLNLIALGDLSPPAEFERAKVENLRKKFGELGELEPTAENIMLYMEDEEWMKFGAGVYNKCTQCHGLNAEGSSGPNLTDDHYLHVKSVEDIATVIRDGVLSKGMPAWGNQLHPNEIVMLSAYIAKLRGTNATGGKGPEGEIPPEWSAGAATPPAETQ